MRFGCKDLTFTYPGSEKPVLDHLTFSMTAPGFNAVFGPSGVGKTSFARLVAGARAQGGSEAEGPFEFSGIDTILYSYNQERLPGWASTGRHLERICPKGREDLKAELIRIFQVGPVLGARFSKLSMGQQNRMNLIRYLIQDFDLLIMDESLANVDESLRQTILLAIKELFSDKLFLYISHNLMEVARFCKDILILGKSAAVRGGMVVRGLDTTGKDTTEKDTRGDVPDPASPDRIASDRAALDRAMLEIMNAV